jgi:hypothetical protein
VAAAKLCGCWANQCSYTPRRRLICPSPEHYAASLRALENVCAKDRATGTIGPQAASVASSLLNPDRSKSGHWSQHACMLHAHLRTRNSPESCASTQQAQVKTCEIHPPAVRVQHWTIDQSIDLVGFSQSEQRAASSEARLQCYQLFQLSAFDSSTTAMVLSGLHGNGVSAPTCCVSAWHAMRLHSLSHAAAAATRIPVASHQRSVGRRSCSFRNLVASAAPRWNPQNVDNPVGPCI